MFPNHDENEVKEQLLRKGFELAVLSLLDSPKAPVKDISLDTLLVMHAAEVIDANRDTYLTVNRTDLWQRATCFYKASKSSPQKLTRNFIVTFEKEEGIDAGALRGSYFEELIQEVNKRLFEGDPFRRVPKKDSELECYFELAGRMIVHSILQGGPTLNCICPAVYISIMLGSIDNAVQEMIIEDIPLNAGTCGLVDFIHEVSYNFQ